MSIVYDAANAAVTFLKTDIKKTRSVAIRELVVGGADGIIDSGDAQAKFITNQDAKRRDDNTPDKVLAIAIQDAGEDPIDPDNSTQYVVIRIIDRQMGMRNIRAVRAQLIPLLKNRVVNVDKSVGGIMQLHYAGRTGHLLDLDFAVHYEAITFEVAVTSLSE